MEIADDDLQDSSPSQNLRHNSSIANTGDLLNMMIRDLKNNRGTKIHRLISKPLRSKDIKMSDKPLRAAIQAGNFLIAKELKMKGFYLSPKILIDAINDKDASMIDSIIKYSFYSSESLQLGFWYLIYNGFIQAAQDLVDQEESLNAYCSSFLIAPQAKDLLINPALLETAFDQAIEYEQDDAACAIIRINYRLISLEKLRKALEKGCVHLLRIVWSGDLKSSIRNIRTEKERSEILEFLKTSNDEAQIKFMKNVLSPISLLNFYISCNKLAVCRKILKWPGVRHNSEVLELLLSSEGVEQLTIEYIANTKYKLHTNDLLNALKQNQLNIASVILRKVTGRLDINSKEVLKEIIDLLDIGQMCVLSIDILTRCKLSNWKHDFTRDLCLKLSALIKKKIDVVYCEAPLLFCVLVAEFMLELAEVSEKYKLRCFSTLNLYVSFGVSLQESIADENTLKFYMTQEDSRQRSVLEIIAKNKFHALLNKNNVGVIVTKMWIGSETNYGIHKVSSLMTSVLAPDGSDEVSQFLTGIDMTKPYSFQYGQIVQAPSTRYMTNGFCILVLVITYQVYIYDLVKNEMLVRPSDSTYELGLNIFIMVMIFGISCEQINRIIYGLKTKGKISINMWKINDWLIGLLIIFVSAEIPYSSYKNGWVSYDRAYVGSGIIHSIMLFMLCMKCINIILTTQSFGPFLSMTLLVFNEIFSFIVIVACFTLCCSGVFTLLFRDTDGYNNLGQSIRTMYEAMIGPFVIDNFQEGKAAFGSVALALYLLIANVYLLNLLIGIVTNVFNKYQLKIESDFRSILINSHCENIWYDECGMLIFLPPPFTAISLVLSPLVLGKRTKKRNEIISKILYLVYAVPYFLLFLIISCLAIPFAYLQGFVIYGRTGKQVPETKPINVFDIQDNSEVNIVTKFSYGKSFSWLFIGIPWVIYAMIRDCFYFWILAYKKNVKKFKVGQEKLINTQFIRNFQKTLAFIESETISIEGFIQKFGEYFNLTSPNEDDEIQDQVRGIIKRFSSPHLEGMIDVKMIRKMFPKKLAVLYDELYVNQFLNFNLPWVYKGLVNFQKRIGTMSRLRKLKLRSKNYSKTFEQEIEKVENCVEEHKRNIRGLLKDCRAIFRTFNKVS